MIQVNIIHKDCEEKAAKDKSLPIDSYLVGYEDDDKIKYDVVQASSKVEIFDFYYDNYHNVKLIRWTDGTINPRTWGYQPKERKKKR
jgi:hypothetical protein